MKHFFELHDVFGEVADPLRELFGGHGVFVEKIAEGLFVEGEAWRGSWSWSWAGSSLRGTGVLASFSCSSRLGAMVRRSHPASSKISSLLRNEAPMIWVL